MDTRIIAKSRPNTEPLRREAIDVARCLALLVVVFGHLTMAVVDVHRGRLRGANLLALYPRWSWVAVAAPMPVFFAAAGWANAATTSTSATRRLRTLVGLAAVVVAAWSVPVVTLGVLGLRAGAIGSGARLATQPLWFLAAYLPLAAAGAPLARLAGRRPVASIGACLVALAAADLVRFRFDGPGWVGWLGFLLVWSVPWLLGAWWRARREAPDAPEAPGAPHGPFAERRAGAALLGGFGLAGAALVAFGGYQASLIDAVPGGRSNTSPPNLYTAVAAVAQVGVLMLVAGALDRIGRRRRTLWNRLGTVSVGVYVWHLTALALCVAAMLGGLPAPRRLGVAWWLSRPLWFACVLALTAALVSATAAVRTALTARERPATTGRPRCAWLGVALAATAAAVVGLVGPATLDRATVCSALFTTAWWLMAEPTAGRSVIRRRTGLRRSAEVLRPVGDVRTAVRAPDTDVGVVRVQDVLAVAGAVHPRAHHVGGGR